jgi:hypothetical protein
MTVYLSRFIYLKIAHFTNRKSQGYIYNDMLFGLIKEYNTNRALYKDFNDYAPFLITELKQQIN